MSRFQSNDRLKTGFLLCKSQFHRKMAMKLGNIYIFRQIIETFLYNKAYLINENNKKGAGYEISVTYFGISASK